MERAKAIIHINKPKFLQKVFSFKKTIVDAYNPKLETSFTVFIPKLTFKYLTPTVMLSISNGRGSVLLRCEHPESLSRFLRDVADQIDTDIFMQFWNQVEDLSTRLIIGHQATIDDSKLFDFNKM